MTGLYQFTVLCTHTEAVPHCKKLAAWCSTQWADRYANIPSQCRQHHSSLSPHFSLLTPSAAQLQKSISHINQAKAWELNGPREHGDHPDTPTPRSPGLPQPSGTHSLEHSPCQSATAHWVGPDWRRKGMSQMHVTLIQCLQTNMWEANGCKLWNKQINIF